MSVEEALAGPGKLVAFEGIDRAGKSSIVRLVPCLLQNCRVAITVTGELQSPLAAVLRQISPADLSPFIKAYWFAADRAWTYEQVCRPALLRGELVLWDRYVYSALVYREAELARTGDGLLMHLVKQVNVPFREADLVIYVDIPADVSAARARAAAPGARSYDTRFLSEVRERYLAYAKCPTWVTVSGRAPLLVVAGQVAEHIRSRLPMLFP